MEILCRVCLTTETELKPLNETFVFQYNLLTNLNITLFDEMPQFSCVTCLNTVKYFKEFRDKAIASEATLKEIICSSFKSEDKQVNETNYTVEMELASCANEINNDNIKCEVKEETEECDSILNKCEIKEEKEEENYSILDSYNNAFDASEDDVENVVKVVDVKNKKNENKKKNELKIRKKTNKKVTIKLKKTKLIQNILTDDKLCCGICPESFDEKNDLKKHLEIHKNDGRCGLCEEHLSCASQLFAHRLLHLPSSQRKCHLCEKRFRCCMYLEYHYRTVHIKTDGQKMPCNICKAVFRTPKILTGHIRETHSGSRYFCDFCSKGFGNKSSLRSHIKQHSNVKSYVCDLCDFSCRYSGGLKDHKIRRHSQKKMYCKNCTRPFASQQDYDRHKCKEKFRICPICGLQLTGNSRLSSHMTRHSDVARYECNRCPAKYKSKASLIAHINRHDGNRTLQCEYCPAKFYTLTVLIKHRRTHTGEKPYVCKVCNKGFTGNHNLKVHMKVHGEYLVIKKNTDSNNVTK